MLSNQFALTASQGQALRNAGQTFIAAIQRIDSDARAEVQRRYYGGTLQVGKPPGGGPVRKSSVSEKTIRQRAIEDGLYAQVEDSKRAALDSHIADLKRNLDASAFDRVQKWVQTSVAPRINQFTTPPLALSNQHGTKAPSNSTTR
jgi:hypothetical protein